MSVPLWPHGTPCPWPSRGRSPPASALANSWQKAGAPSQGAEGSPCRPWKQQEVESNSQAPVQYRKVGEPPLSWREATARACGQDGPASGPASRVWPTTGLSRCPGLSCTRGQSSASTLPGKDPRGHGRHAGQLHLPGTPCFCSTGGEGLERWRHTPQVKSKARPGGLRAASSRRHLP